MFGFIYDSLGEEEMSYIRKHIKKWQAVVRKKKIRAIKSFWKKSDESDVSVWVYKVEA